MIKRTLKIKFVLADGKLADLNISNIKEDITEEELVTAARSLLASRVVLLRGHPVNAIDKIELIETDRNILFG